MVAADCDGSAGSVQPATDAWISYQPESTSQWKTPSAAVVSGFVVGWIPGLETSTGAYGPDRTRDDRARDDRPRQERPELVLPSPVARVRPAEENTGYAQSQGGLDAAPGIAGLSDPAQTPPGQLRRLPSRSPAGPGPIGPMGAAGSGGSSPSGLGSAGLGSAGLGGQGSPRSAPYSGPQPVATPSASPGYQSVGGVSLAEAVQAAHEEGQEFGGSVARDAPALWLEAVLARKPRMPSDLEARLLQGSALPIDFLLHDEVRHALRRGFWDALERTRR